MEQIKIRSWKTTIAGIGSILGSISGAIKLWLAGNYLEAVTVGFTGISSGIGLMFARDNTVPSSAVPKAAERDAAIKGDTGIITKAVLLIGLCFMIGCAGNVVYKTINSVELATNAAVGGYFDLVVSGQVRTNEVPKVTKAYDQFQIAIRKAIDAAQFNKNAPATPELIAQSTEILNTIAKEKGVK